MGTKPLNRRTSVLKIGIFALFCAMACSHLTISGQEAEKVHFFEQNIRPLLIEHCYECHSEEHKIKGGLRLDLQKGWEIGGDSGRAIEPGQPDQSLLLEAMQFTNPDLEMPPKGKIPDHKIDLIKQWIRMGAPDPRNGELESSEENTIDLESGRQFWSFRPIKDPDIPSVQHQDWPRTPIDHFIMAGWEKEDIMPVEDASPLDLLRRVYFDLVGLPPSPEEIQSFAADPSEKHYQDIVDQLLASKGFGEKWGRHWLDLARYAESTGGGRSSVLANAWRYRNYVIESYNTDKPIDHFIREQLAGDLMDWETPEQRSNQLIATAYLAIGPKNLDLQDKEMLRMNTVDEQIDTIGRSLLGMTLGCVRCHDHKFDPIPMEDYYALAGIFRSTRTLVRDNVSRLVEQDLPVSPRTKAEYETHQKSVKEVEAAIKEAKKIKKPNTEQKALLVSLDNQLKALKKSAPAPLPKAISVNDEKDAGDYALCVRGNVHQLGDPVKRGFMQVTLPKNPTPPTIAKGQSGRLELADWVTSDNNPLTRRVYVNRVWHHLFGRGIVRSVDNFGSTGDAPSHPALLDYLATRFSNNRWSTKQLVRQIVLSRTYRLSTKDQPENRHKDPDNALRWAMKRRHLTAEAIRDSVLVASGQLQNGHIKSMLPGAASSDSALRNAKLDYEIIVQPKVRSVYIPIFREEGRNALLDVFDFANPSFTVGRRIPGVRPTQSLYLMNNEWVMDQAEFTAQRLLTDLRDTTTQEKVRHLYLRTLSRAPSDSEMRIALDYLNQATDLNQSGAWAGLVHSLFSCVDFRYMH